MIRFRYIVCALCAVLCIPVFAGTWVSHLAYNNVSHIAMSEDCVYALSDGNLYCVDKQTERMQTHFSGLQGSGITCIYYDAEGKQLIVGYETGKIDIVRAKGVKYIGELYDKDMTQRKTIHNVTIDGRTAYLSTAYGVQTFDLDELKLVDSYWLRPGGQETELEDVLLTNDSIYAFTADSMFSASRKENIVDYTYWRREKRSSRIQPDPEKGKHYADANSQWYAGGAEGIVREMLNERNTYKPQGPLNNVPYTIHADQGEVWVVSGGRWANQFNTPGVVMHYDGARWTNIEQVTIQQKTGRPTLDFMNIAVDPLDKQHYYVTSFGTGLYEFRGDQLVRQMIAGEDNTMVSVVSGMESEYTRTDVSLFDNENNLWFLCCSNEAQLQCLDASGNWHAVNLMDGNAYFEAYTPNKMFIDKREPNYKWIGTARYNTGLYVLDDRGTRWDGSDDRYRRRTEWTNQYGRSFAPATMRALMQDSEGRVWIGSDIGVAYIDAGTDFFESDAIIQPDVMDDNGENPVTSMEIYALCEDAEGNIWIGTSGLGVYVLNPTATEIIAHYTTGNSTMPSNAILSLASDKSGSVWVGTSSGLAQYDMKDTPESSDRTIDAEGRSLGSVLQWKLHYSYQNPQEIIPTPSRIYSLAGGALFYIDQDDEIHYLDKSSGLNGSTVSKIAYDPQSKRLVIAYEDGRVDLLSTDGYVLQMPDIHMKANSISTTINGVTAGSSCTYLAMSFGILAINPAKGEVNDTYYIGDEAADVDVRLIVETDGTLYAFRKDSFFYYGDLKDNLVDYHFWNKRVLPAGTLTHAAVFNNKLHILVNNTLYYRQNDIWVQATGLSFRWIHAYDGQMVVWIDGQGVCRLSDTYQPSLLTSQYSANDAVFAHGAYWLAEEDRGLVRLSAEGDEAFIPNGPNSNFGYFVGTKHGRVYATVGARWAAQYNRLPKVNIYDGFSWTGINYKELITSYGVLPMDPVGIAVDNSDPDHFYIASYQSGVFEYNHGAITPYRQYVNGGTLYSVDPKEPDIYTRTEGIMMDANGYLWVLNPTGESGNPEIHVMTPNHVWNALSEYVSGKPLALYTPRGIWPDRRNSNYKWFIDQRHQPGIFLLDDGGTPTKSSDDRLVKRTEFIDQNGKPVTPEFYYCWAQDRNDRIWIGTQSGIIIIPPSVDFFSSNACERIIIPRRDGTGLGDYLLGEETINCMAVDGGNRMWIGTAGSGLYVIENDTITVAHFTENNSLLPSDAIQSITIVPETGEVFVGTNRGLASYLSDSSEPSENMKEAYAFPNPVRPDYGGSIAIANLMENSEVNIIDSGGNLVCKTRSHGGTAVWDGKLPDGRMATAGVYTALCNAKGGHAAVKILIIR